MSDIFGNGSSSAQQASTTAANNSIATSNNALGLATSTAPGLKQAQDYYSGLLNGGTSLTTGLAPSINATEQQFAAAQQSLLNGSYARGGGLTQGMNNLAAGKAQTLSNLFSGAQGGAAQSLGNLDLGILSGATGQSNAATGANSSASAASLGQQQVNNQSLGGIGQLLAALLGMN